MDLNHLKYKPETHGKKFFRSLKKFQLIDFLAERKCTTVVLFKKYVPREILHYDYISCS